MENKSDDLKVGDKVARLGSEKDYTTGRRGTIVQIGDGLNVGRARVLWASEKDGSPITTPGHAGHVGVRTWVNVKFLKKEQ